MLKILKKYTDTDNQQDIFGDKYRLITELHQAANNQYIKTIPLALKILFNRMRGRQYDFSHKILDDMLISIDPKQGRFLYNIILACKPKVVFEYGLSHGVSAIYICQALQKLQNFNNINNHKLFSAEILQRKINSAQNNIKKFNLEKYFSAIEGDILKNQKLIPNNIDLVHMDGFPNLNLAVLKLIEHKLSTNAVIITDDYYLFKYEMKDYIYYLNNNSQYSSTEINISDGVLITIKNN